MAATRRTPLAVFAACTAAAALFLLFAGGMVTSTDSGLAVPDWPLAYGMVFPPMVGGIFYEHGHRLIAATVGLLVFTLAAWLQRAEPRPWVRRLGWCAAATVVAQGLLGGLTVLLLLPPPVSIAHACLGPTMFTLVVCLAWAVSPAGTMPPSPADLGGTSPVSGGALTMFTLAAAVMAAVQLLLGAILRHTGQGLAAHIAGAGVLAVSIVSLAVRAHGPGVPAAVRRASVRLLLLLAAQLGLGLSALRWPAHAVLLTAHQTTGSLVLAQAVWTAWMAQRLTIGPGSDPRIAGVRPRNASA